MQGLPLDCDQLTRGNTLQNNNTDSFNSHLFSIASWLGMEFCFYLPSLYWAFVWLSLYGSCEQCYSLCELIVFLLCPGDSFLVVIYHNLLLHSFQHPILIIPGSGIPGMKLIDLVLVYRLCLSPPPTALGLAHTDAHNFF